MTMPQGKLNKTRIPPYKLAGVAVLVVAALVIALVYAQFKGAFTAVTPLQMLASRAGLVMDSGSKVTYNGVQIGRVGDIVEVQHDGEPAAKFTLDVYPKYLKLIPANVVAKVEATTLFGNKFVSLTSPTNPTPQRITPQQVIDARSVTVEINTLFETITSIAQKVDPVKLNLTLSAAANALSGLGDKFGQSILNANAILDDVNPQQPQVRRDIQKFADLAETYAAASPDLFDFLNNAVVTARTLNKQRQDLDTTLLAAAGFGNTGAEIFKKGQPYFVRGIADLVPSAKLLDTYSPEVYCSIRNYHDVEPAAGAAEGTGNGYSLRTVSEALSGAGLALSLPGLGITAATGGLAALSALITGSPNPYTYPENLPRVNAHGGPGGAPGCWQPITRELWPAPYLVMDAGASLAPYNHIDTGSPYAVEYVWGRQVGDNTINP